MSVHPFKILFSCVYAGAPVKAKLTDEMRHTDPAIEKVIEKTWKGFSEKSRMQAFSLVSESLCSLNAFRENGRDTELLLGQTTYREYLGTNLKNPWIHGKYGNEFLANPLGINALLLTGDNRILFGVRKKNLAVDQSLFDMFGGYLIYPQEGTPGMEIDLRAETKYKMLKYVNLKPDEIEDVSCLGLVRHRRTLKPELLFTLKTSVHSDRLLTHETQEAPGQKYLRFMAVEDTREALQDFHIRHRNDMTLALAAAWSLYASRRKYWSTFEEPPRFHTFHRVPPKTALVLGGGFAKGGTHIGVLKVLEHIGLKIDLIVGNSIGGLMGALYASKGSYEGMEKAALDFKWNMVADWSLPKISLIKGDKLEAFLEKELIYPDFEDLSVPLCVITTDLNSGEEVVLCGESLRAKAEAAGQQASRPFHDTPVEFMTAPLAQSIRATCSVPGIFSPVEINGRTLCDGLIVDNVPVRVARMLGAEFIIAVDLSDEGRVEELNTIVHILLRAQSLLVEALSRVQLAEADVIIRPDLSGVRFNDFSQTPLVIQKGVETALTQIEEIHRKFDAKKRLRWFGLF